MESPQDKPVTPQASSNSGPKILVVDDSKLIRVAATKILEPDYLVVLAHDGEEAWEMIQADASIQVVFSDLTMPKLDGFSLLKRARESDDTRIKNLPLIIMTLDTDDESRRETALRLGATDFISKPFNSIDLKARAKAHATMETITRELKHRAELLERNFNKDPLTGLNNRSYFVEKLWQDCSYSVRHQTSLSTLRFDIDSFNQMFVQMGKESAHGIMQAVAEKVSTCLRDEDTAARIGLSTIVIVAPGSTLKEARLLAESLQKQVARITYTMDSVQYKVRLSIALYSPDESKNFKPDDILRALEKLVNEAMDKGGNQIRPAMQINVNKPADEKKAAPTVDTDESAGIESRVTGLGNGLLESLDEALLCLETGNYERVRENLPALIRKFIPLVMLADEDLRNELVKSLKV